MRVSSLFGRPGQPWTRGALGGLGALAALGCTLLALPREPAGVEEPAAVASSYLEWQLAEERAQRLQLELRVGELEAELAWAQESLLRKEQEFQDWLRVLSGLAPELVPGGPGGPRSTSSGTPSAPPEPALAPGLVEAARLAGALRGLLRSEGIRGLDLLEPGTFDGESLGPVVFRTLDDQGRLTGSISATRLRLEAAAAARTVTLVLEQGSELVGGQREPFEELRLPFVQVDPRPWLELVPELFSGSDLLDEADDGRWDVDALRLRLNALLGLDAEGGFYRLRYLGGVSGGSLLDLQLAEHGRDGRLLRYLFADRAELGLVDTGALLELSGCVAVRGDEKRAFPGGGLRIYLPRADHAEWRAANLPGLAPPQDD